MAEITREQIDKAIEAAEDCDAHAITDALGGPDWYGREDTPADVLTAWGEIGYRSLLAALIRWRDSLPVAKVARWDADPGTRPVVRRFAAHMEAVLRANDHKTGWLDMSREALMTRLGEEVEELAEAHRNGDAPEIVMREAVDVANFAMMIADVSLWRIGLAADALGHAFVPGSAEHGHEHQCAAPEPDGMRQCGYPEAAHEPTLMERARAKLAAMSPEATQRLWFSLCAIADDPEMVGPEPQPAEDSPERLKARREALGMNQAAAAYDLGLAMLWHDLDRLETTRTDDDAVDRARYAAALSAEEQRRAQACAMHPEYAPVHDMIAGVVAEAMAAPEVVDVPQPLVIRKRLAGSEHSAAWSSDEPDVVTLYIGGAGEDAPLALLRAMLAAIDAQDRMVAIKGHHARWDAQLAPTRPEPRYKVGDWVRDGDGTARLVVEAPQWSRIQGQWRYLMASWSYSESELTPAIDPALRETARKTVAWLRGGSSLPHGCSALPGYRDGVHDRARWAAQLERLLGEA